MSHFRKKRAKNEFLFSFSAFLYVLGGFWMLKYRLASLHAATQKVRAKKTMTKSNTKRSTKLAPPKKETAEKPC